MGGGGGFETEVMSNEEYIDECKNRVDKVISFSRPHVSTGISLGGTCLILRASVFTSFIYATVPAISETCPWYRNRLRRPQMALRSRA